MSHFFNPRTANGGTKRQSSEIIPAKGAIATQPMESEEQFAAVLLCIQSPLSGSHKDAEEIMLHAIHAAVSGPDFMVFKCNNGEGRLWQRFGEVLGWYFTDQRQTSKLIAQYKKEIMHAANEYYGNAERVFKYLDIS